MYDDPGLFLDALLVAALGSFLAYLLVTEWRRAWRIRRIDSATALAGISILAFLWFLAWMITDGLIPYGLWALCSAGALLTSIPLVARVRR
jgi:hypothetical protein